MLEIDIDKFELFDERTNTFLKAGPAKLQLEHSLISISKWESKWEKPFLSSEEKTNEELLDYIKDMTINKNVDPTVYLGLNQKHMEAINRYISAKMTATWFSDNDRGISKSIVTSERIYYWMIALNIPFECRKWHLNQLITLIRVCSVENSPKKKLSKYELLRKNHELNAQRRRLYNSKG